MKPNRPLTEGHPNFFAPAAIDAPRRAPSSSQFLSRVVLFLLSLVAPEIRAAEAVSPTATFPFSTRYQTIKVDAVEIFYREAGPTNGPVILLLHGFPASSFMYRDLIPRLAGRFRLIAPDYPGFGYSSAPRTNEFEYTFDHLSEVIEKFTEKLGVSRCAIYMQDFGGPVGFRLAARHPERVSALVVQNANAYTEGLPDSFWSLAKAFWKEPSPVNSTKLREAAMSDAALEWNYTHGVTEHARINPDSWVLQRTLLGREGNKDAMMALLYDYRRNLDEYPKWHDYFRKHQPPTLIVWGRNDIIFPPSGAHPYLRDLPKAELHLLDTGHFALEDKHLEVAALIGDFLGRKLTK